MAKVFRKVVTCEPFIKTLSPSVCLRSLPEPWAWALPWSGSGSGLGRDLGQDLGLLELEGMAKARAVGMDQVSTSVTPQRILLLF